MSSDTTSRHCDVLVVGSGAGGLSAAVCAARLGLDVIVVEKEPVFGGTTAISAGVIWIPGSSHATRAGVSDSRESALAYLRNEVGNRLDRDLAEAFLAHGPRMLDFLEANSHVSYALAAPWPDYHPEVGDAMPGGRSLWVDHFNGRRLGAHFANLRRPLETTMIMGGMSIAREDVPHFLRMTRSLRSALYVGRLFLRHLFDRIGHSRGTRIANGNALVARLALTLEGARRADAPRGTDDPVAAQGRPSDGSGARAQRQAGGGARETRSGARMRGLPRQRRDEGTLLSAPAGREEPLLPSSEREQRGRDPGRARGGSRVLSRIRASPQRGLRSRSFPGPGVRRNPSRTSSIAASRA